MSLKQILQDFDETFKNEIWTYASDGVDETINEEIKRFLAEALTKTLQEMKLEKQDVKLARQGNKTREGLVSLGYNLATSELSERINNFLKGI